MAKSKVILTTKLAEKIQDEIYANMPSEKKIKIAGQLFLLCQKLKNSKAVLKNGARRTIKKHS